MVSLGIEKSEVANGRLSPEHLREAAEAIRWDGFVLLEDVIETAHLDALRDKMLEDLNVILSLESKPYNFNAGHVQQDPPPFPPYLFRDVLMNDLVVQVTKEILGPGVKNTYYSGNTNLPGSPRQPVHPDVGQLWPDLDAAPPAFALVVNVPVVPTGERNGSTELWPGTHRDVAMHLRLNSLRVPESKLEEWREENPPVQPRMPLGSVLIRDIRLWHAGMPNLTDQPRPMIAMIHSCDWWGQNAPIVFQTGSESFFAGSDLTTHAIFRDPPLDYLNRNRQYDYQPDDPRS